MTRSHTLAASTLAILLASGCSTDTPHESVSTEGSSGSGGAQGPAASGGAAGAMNTGGTPGAGAGTGGASADNTGGESSAAAGSGGMPAGGVGGAGGAGGGEGAVAGGGASGGADAGAPGSDSTGPSAGCGKAAPQGTTFSLNIQNKERQYIVRVPAGYDVNTPYVLVFGFHGLGGTMQGVDGSGYFGMQQAAGDQAIFISPNGYESSDDYDTPVSGNGFWDENGQDVEFVAAIVDWAKENLCVDTDRIFSIGHSFGGMMSDNIGCKLTSSFRAIAPASSSFRRVYVDLDTDCTGQPIAAMLTHGTNDNFVPFEEGEEARDYFLGTNGCSSDSTPTPPSGCVNYTGCTDGYPVMWCEHGEGHGVWDNGGTGTSLGAAAWEFFSQF